MVALKNGRPPVLHCPMSFALPVFRKFPRNFGQGECAREKRAGSAISSMESLRYRIPEGETVGAPRPTPSKTQFRFLSGSMLSMTPHPVSKQMEEFESTIGVA